MLHVRWTLCPVAPYSSILGILEDPSIITILHYSPYYWVRAPPRFKFSPLAKGSWAAWLPGMAAIDPCGLEFRVEGPLGNMRVMLGLWWDNENVMETAIWYLGLAFFNQECELGNHV